MTEAAVEAAVETATLGQPKQQGVALGHIGKNDTTADQGKHNEGEWHEVIRKQKLNKGGGNERVDVATTEKITKHDGTISFYFSEFPEMHGAKEMLRAFQLYREATEMVIPPRRNNQGSMGS